MSDYRSSDSSAESISPRSRFQRQRSKHGSGLLSPPEKEKRSLYDQSHTSGNGSNKELYDLQGVICHSGTLNQVNGTFYRSAESNSMCIFIQGHYIAYTADYKVSAIDGSMKILWLRCDDEDVRPVEESVVEEAEA